MTYYEQQIHEIRNQLFQKDYLYRQLMQSKEFIHAHFAKNITIDDIAAAAFFSKYHFIRLFKSVYHCTPHDYLTSVRLEKAKRLLQEGNTVSEVCLSVGFSSINSFKILFRRHTFHTPFAFKKAVEKNSLPCRHPISPFLFYYKKSNFQVGSVAN